MKFKTSFMIVLFQLLSVSSSSADPIFVTAIFKDKMPSGNACANYLWALGSYFAAASDPLFAIREVATENRGRFGYDVEAHFRVLHSAIKSAQATALGYAGQLVPDYGEPEGVQIKSKSEFDRKERLIRVFTPRLVHQGLSPIRGPVTEETKIAVLRRLYELNLPEVVFQFDRGGEIPSSLKVVTDELDFDLVSKLLDIPEVEHLEIGARGDIRILRNKDNLEREKFPYILQIRTNPKLVYEGHKMTLPARGEAASWNLLSGLMAAKMNTLHSQFEFGIRWNETEFTRLAQVDFESDGLIWQEARFEVLHQLIRRISAREINGASVKLEREPSAWEDQMQVIEVIEFKVPAKSSSK